MTISSFISELQSFSSDNVFNPYSDTCPLSDRPDAAKTRRHNLANLIEGVAASGIDTIWVARDLGYRGGRRTGVPLTDEIHLGSAEFLLKTNILKRATIGEAVRERTASIIWKVLHAIDQPVMLWNVFPFHPYEDSNPMSNRCHTSKERELTLPFLWTLIDLLQPKQIVAIGRDAQAALYSSPIPVVDVRHPSYGGQREFEEKLLRFYGISADRNIDPEPSQLAL